MLCYAVLLQLPKLLELVGLGYTSWFVYRYLLFKVRPVWTAVDVQRMGGRGSTVLGRGFGATRRIAVDVQWMKWLWVRAGRSEGWVVCWRLVCVCVCGILPLSGRGQQFN